MQKELKPVTNYVEPEYPEIEGIIASEEADCQSNDICTSYEAGPYVCENGFPFMYYVTVRDGCDCQDSQCECADVWYNWW